MSFISGSYTNTFSRFLHSVFIETPAQVWFRFLSMLIPSSAQFANYSGVPDSVLLDSWKAAQKNLSTNPFPDNAYGGGTHPADPRAATVQPSHVAVISVSDTKISDLVKVDSRWGIDKDPSGAIIVAMGQGFLEYQACHAMTFCWTRPRVYAATSKIPVVLQYEFENIILARLGYNVEQR